MKRILFFAFVVFTISQGVSQTFFDTATKKSWEGEGTLMGADAKFKMQWDKVLDGRFYRLKFENQRETTNGKIVFKAIGFYRVTDSVSFHGTWFDSRGISFPLKGILAENQLVVHWGTPDTEIGKTVYTVVAGGKIAVEDFIEQNGELVNFGKSIYQ